MNHAGIVSIWDTQGDAIQAGRERFGLDPILVKKFDPRDPHRFAILQTQLRKEASQVVATDR